MSNQWWTVDNHELSKLYSGGGYYSDKTDLEGRYYLVREGCLTGLYRSLRTVLKRKRYTKQELFYWLVLFIVLSYVSSILTNGFGIHLGAWVAWIMPYLTIGSLEVVRKAIETYRYSVDRCVTSASKETGRTIDEKEFQRSIKSTPAWSQLISALRIEEPKSIEASIIEVSSDEALPENATTLANDTQMSPGISQAEYYRAYIDERGTLTPSYVSVQQGLDKTLITLATGVLAASITVVWNAKPLSTDTFPILFTCWFCLGTTVCLMLLSMVASQVAFKSELHNLDVKYEPLLHNGAKTMTRKGENWNTATLVFELVAIGALLVAIGLFIWFSILTAPSSIHQKQGDTTMSNKQNPNNAKIETATSKRPQEQKTQAPKTSLTPSQPGPQTTGGGNEQQGSGNQQSTTETQTQSDQQDNSGKN